MLGCKCNTKLQLHKYNLVTACFIWYLVLRLWLCSKFITFMTPTWFLFTNLPSHHMNYYESVMSCHARYYILQGCVVNVRI